MYSAYRRLIVCCVVCLALGFCPAAQAAGALDPQAEKILQEMSAQKKKDIRASMEFVDTMDEVNPNGQKIQYSHVRRLVVSEPKQFWLESTGDTNNTTIWKDDTTFTLFDRTAHVYGQIASSGTIDQTLDMLLDAYGVTTPLADLLSNDLYDVLIKNVKTCSYQGLHSVEGIPCHHIAATQKNIDWQIWVDAGPSHLLRKIIITYKQKPGAPQYTAVLKSFYEVADLPADTFTFRPPKDAEKIPFLPVKKLNKKQP